MTAKHKPYPKYKPSGIEWLGDIPKDWTVNKFSREVKIAEGQVNPEHEPYRDMTLVGPNHIESGTGRLIEKESASDQHAESGKYFCHSGNVLYSKIRPALAKVALADEDCLCSADMYPLHGRHTLNNRFIFWYLLSRYFVAWSTLESERVAMPKINRDTLNDLRLIVPPPDEQDSIADFLDSATSKIDALISKQQELIERLQEKRRALISRCVTRGLPPEAAQAAGLDPHPKLKPSGVEWIGDIPENWECVRTRFLCDMTTGERDTQDAEDEGDYPFFVRSDTIERISTWSFDGEGVLTSGDGAGVGKIFHHYTGKMEIHQRVYLFYNFRRMLGRYFYHFLKENLFKVALEGGAKSTVDSLRRPLLLDFSIAVPPIEEQQVIVELIDRETTKLDSLVLRVEDVIDRLREYRTALITAAVTGKIDVREVTQ